MMNERGDEQASTLFFRESLLHEMYFSEKPRLAELTVRYEALRCDIMQQYYMNKDYDNVIRIATSLDFTMMLTLMLPVWYIITKHRLM